jgi:hypothetical protein
MFETPVEKIDHNPGRTELYFVAGDPYGDMSRSTFSLVRDIGTQTNPGVSTEPAESSGSESSLNLARHWLFDCLLNHGSCGPFTTAYKGNTWLPTRLIHVTETEASICYGENPPEGILPYATLSYAWGGKIAFTLQGSNINQLELGLPMAELTQTFRDAILVYRALQIRYLWIDSLCIMQSGQGSEEDKAHELKNMGLVYKHCCLNIAATGFPDGSRGFFCESRHPYFEVNDGARHKMEGQPPSAFRQRLPHLGFPLAATDPVRALEY